MSKNKGNGKFELILLQYTMLQLFKNKNYRTAASLLDNIGLNNDDFKDFQLQQISSNLTAFQLLFPSIRENVREMKLSPLKALKLSLFYLHIFHISNDSKVFEMIMELLHELQVRVHALLRAKKCMTRSEPKDTLSTSKDFLEKQQQIVGIDLSSIVLGKIVIPLISFQEKLITCSHLFDKKSQNFNLGQCETWCRMNLLRKIVEIGPDTESLGRYFFKQSAHAVLCLMKILNSDIQGLYKKIVEFFRRKIISIKLILEQNHAKIDEIIVSERINQFLMMNQQLEVINEKLRVLYNGRYFIHHLANNSIYLPSLFTENQHIDLFYKIKQYQIQHQKRHKQQYSIKTKRKRQTGETIQQI